MAKYKIKAALVATLKEKGVINPDDTMTIVVPHQAEGELQTHFELTFDINDALETANHRAMVAIEETAAPKLKVNNDWHIMDPAIKWFEKLADGDPTTSNTVHLDGTEVVSRKMRKFLSKYAKEAKVTLPPGRVKADLATHIENAISFYSGQ